MQVKVRLFAGLKELVGEPEISIELENGASIHDLEEELRHRYPRLRPLLPSLAFAVDEEYRARDHVLRDRDEVALIPPISGGTFELTEDALDPAPLLEQVRRPDAGAVVLFLGTVRGEDQGRRVLHLEYDAYKSMAEKEMRSVEKEVLARWPSTKLAVRHRIGRVNAGETALIIAVSAPHRAEAFDACRHAIDRIKEVVPIWKKEVSEDGEAWLEGHQVD